MAKPKMTASELKDQIVREVRRHAHCDGFKSIQLYALAAGEIPGVNWAPSVVNYGEASEALCDAALRGIVPRYQQIYDMRG
jgi:hypothetical protein